MVIADLDNDNAIYLLDNGALEHSKNCKEQEHNIDKRLKAAVNDMKSVQKLNHIFAFA